MTRTRVAMALLFAPLATMPAMCVGALMRGHGMTFEWDELLVMCGVYLPFAYAAALVIGLPLHIWMRRSYRDGWWGYALAGGAIAYLVACIPGLGTFATATDRIACALAGVLAGLSFRAIVGPATSLPPPQTWPPQTD